MGKWSLLVFVPPFPSSARDSSRVGVGVAVVTDWGAMNDRLEGFRSGCDLNMPGGSAYMEKEALRAVKSGTLPASAVDDSARRVLKLALWAAETRKRRI